LVYAMHHGKVVAERLRPADLQPPHSLHR
jgi:hypothetical protein